MNQLTIITHQNTHTAVSASLPTGLASIGGAANRAAATAVFTDYLTRMAGNTIVTHAAALETFAQFLSETGMVGAPTAHDLQHQGAAWDGLTWGIVAAFVKWMLGQGYTTATVNNRLSTVKTYAALAAKAGDISPDELTLIRSVSGYGGRAARMVDERREITRVGCKKAQHVSLTPDQAAALKSCGDANTGQGRRDALLMALLLDHGLRVGEVAGLRVSDFDLKSGKLVFYRPKVDRVQTHRLSPDTLKTAVAYLTHDALALGPVFLGSRKDGRLTDVPMTARSLTRRVNELGKLVGVDGLSAHDCRHYWATNWSGRVNIIRLQEAGGWSSLAMPRRYTEWANIANEGMI